MLLALDLAIKTGWAQGKPGTRPDCGLVTLPRDGGQGERANALHDFIAGRFETEGITALAYEQPPAFAGVRSAPATRLLFALETIVLLLGVRFEVPVLAVQVSSLKKHWTGDGRADKQAMMRAAIWRGFTPEDHNVADALAVWDWGQWKLDPKLACATGLAGMGVR